MTLPDPTEREKQEAINNIHAYLEVIERYVVHTRKMMELLPKKGLPLDPEWKKLVDSGEARIV